MSAIRVASLRAPLLAARSYATAVQPPVRLFGIDGRYATALYSAAVKTNALDKVEADLKTLNATIASDKGVNTFFKSPVVSTTVKRQGVEAIVKKLKLQSQVGNLLSALAENGRLNEMEKITAAFGQLMLAHRGEVTAVVTSAIPLEGKLKSQLEAALKKNFIEAKQTLTVTAKVDPSILGGMIVQIGDRTIDLSVASKVKRINAALAENI